MLEPSMSWNETPSRKLRPDCSCDNETGCSLCSALRFGAHVGAASIALRPCYAIEAFVMTSTRPEGAKLYRTCGYHS